MPSAFYTIGLTSKFDHPELFVSGLSRGLLDHVVEHFVNRISAGRRFGDGHKYSDLVGDTECCLRAVRPAHFQRYMPEALEILESASTALQCVWPDPKTSIPGMKASQKTCATASLICGNDYAAAITRLGGRLRGSLGLRRCARGETSECARGDIWIFIGGKLQQYH